MPIEPYAINAIYASYQDRLKDYNAKYFLPRPPKVITEDAPAFVDISAIWGDAKAVLESNGFYALSIVGPQGSGKTTIAADVAARALTDGFKVIFALPEDFMTAPAAWITQATEGDTSKVCIILDDLSYFADTVKRGAQAQIKNMVSRFRHIFEGQVFVVYITHRLHSAPPMLRNSGTWIFSNMQSADRDDALEIIGRSREEKSRLEAIYRFISRVAIEGPKFKKITYSQDKQDKVFVWGTADNAGDGRLMALHHGGKLAVFVSKKTTDLNLKDYRIAPVLPTEGETDK